MHAFLNTPQMFVFLSSIKKVTTMFSHKFQLEIVAKSQLEIVENWDTSDLSKRFTLVRN